MAINTLSHLTRGAWIEIGLYQSLCYLPRSHLTRGAWIEIRFIRVKPI